MVEYICARRALGGFCESSGIQFNVYTMNRTDQFSPDEYDVEDVNQLVSDLAQSVCLSPNDLQFESGKCPNHHHRKGQ